MEEQQVLRAMLRHTVEAEELRQTLESMGLAATYANAIQFQMVKKAAGGDLSAAKYLRETLDSGQQADGLPDLRSLSTAQLRRLIGEGSCDDAEEGAG